MRTKFGTAIEHPQTSVLHPCSLKHLSREIGTMISNAALASCWNSKKAEKKLLLRNLVLMLIIGPIRESDFSRT